MLGVLHGRSRSPIALDINSWEVRAVQLTGDAGSHTLYRAGILPRLRQPGVSDPIGRDEVESLVAMLRRRGFEGDRVVIAAPPAACASQVLTLPDRESGAPIETIARAEIARARRDGMSGFELAAWYLPPRGRTEQGMTVACDHAGLCARLDVFEQAGLETVAVDLEETALQRACDPPTGEPEADGAIDAVLNIGWDVSLGALTLGGVVVYTRRIAFGVADLIRKLAERTGIDVSDAGRLLSDAERLDPSIGTMHAATQSGWTRLAHALASEIDTSVTYVSHAYRQAPIGKVTLAGFGANCPAIREILDEVLGMPVRAYGSGPEGPGVLRGCSPADRGRLATAYGLARRFDA
ncbi:MAG: pilus assembly protein PilM [Planctomycetota bacterium]